MSTIVALHDSGHDIRLSLDEPEPDVCPQWTSPIDSCARSDRSELPTCTRSLRSLVKHPRFMHYNRLIVSILAANMVLFGYGLTVGRWWTSHGSALQTIATIAQANFLLSIVPRQQFVINFISWLATRPSTMWPLRLRWMLGKYSHLGGLHVGAAVAGTMWYLAFVVSSILDFARGVGHVSSASVVVSVVVFTLFALMAGMAMPQFRASAHDRFEVTHRFCGWAALMLVWLNTVLFVTGQQTGRPIALALLATPAIWMLVITTACALWPWLLLRKVPITVERPSSHVALVGFDHGVTPAIGTTRSISRQPFVGWHHFANVPTASGSAGYRMVVSRAGDWTAAFIDDPPDHVWVRGMPTVGVANVRKLFKKVVYIVTGSGIGPALGHLLADANPSHLVWVTRNPRETYGDALCDEVVGAQPDAVIWNTDERGKPDMVRLAYRAYIDADAEAVICISNKRVTRQIVHEFERRGIPAFGPIWDS